MASKGASNGTGSSGCWLRQEPAAAAAVGDDNDINDDDDDDDVLLASRFKPALSLSR